MKWVNYVVEQILPNLFRLEIPLPGNPLRSVNSYVIKGYDRNLIIDTGLNRNECRDALLCGIHELAIDLDKTDFFITHMHADHVSLVPTLIASDAHVYGSSIDTKAFNSYSNFTKRFKTMHDNGARNGLSVDEIEQVIQHHPAHKYGPDRRLHFTVIEESTRISVGDYNLVCIATPGHTMGHMCLYEPEKKILFSGDHILGDITPNISHWFGSENSLGIFLESLTKVAAIPVNLVLPGHRRILTSCQKRIDELIQHHYKRAAEVYDVLRNGPMNAYNIAAKMTWGVANRTFNEFPGPQKWFAIGETIAHARYLESRGYIQSEMRDKQVMYEHKAICG